MKRLFFFVLFILSVSLCFAGQGMGPGPGLGKGGAAAPSCSASTDYVGVTGDGTTDTTASLNYLYCQKAQATASSGCSSGNAAQVKFRHAGTDTDNAKVALFTGAVGDTEPTSSNTLIGSWVVLTSSTAGEWASANTSGAVMIGSYYWVCWIADNTYWDMYYSTGDANSSYYLGPLDYTNPPSDLSGSWSGSTRVMSLYETIGP